MNLVYRILLSIFLIMASSISIWGQEPCMAHYTIDDGLPSNTVYYIYADSKGFLWFATDKGIARYNGIYFQTFTTADGIPDNEIFSFQEDYEDRLWISTFNGKLCYFKDGAFHTEKNTPWLRKLPQARSFANHINLESDSSITYQFTNDSYFINIKGEKAKVVSLNEVMDIIRKEKDFLYGKYYVKKISNNRFCIYDKRKRILIDDTGAVHSVTNHSDKSIFQVITGPNSDFFSFNNSIHTPDGKSYKYDANPKSKQEYFFFHQNDLTTFLGRDDGLYIDDSIHLFKDLRIYAIAEDFQGNYWISPYANGIYRLSRDFRKTTFYPQSYKGNIRHALSLDSTPYFITKQGSVYRGQKNERNFELIFKNKHTLFPFNTVCIILPNFQAVIMNREQLILLSSLNKEIVAKVINNKFKIDVKYLMFNDSYLYGLDPAIICKVNLGSGKNRFVQCDTILFRSPDLDRISACTMDERNRLWYSVRDSIFSLSDNQPVFVASCKDKIFRKLLVSKNSIVTITHDNLLVVFDRMTQPVRTHIFTDSSSIWSDMMLIDDKHTLIATNKNYYLLSLSSPYKVQPLENIFLPRQPEYMYADSRYCYFFKEGNITRIAKSYLYEEPSPRVVFSALTTQSGKYPLKPRINVRYNESRNIKVLFSAISFCSKELNYQFSLSDGKTDNWENTKGEELNLLMPSYGTYTIKVRAKTISSDYSQPAVLTLVISRPYWATWWFWSLAVLSIAAITWIIIRWRTKRIIAKKQQEFEAEKRYQQAEYKALNALMNPHFIFNSMNNIQGLINEDEKQTANDYLVIFSEMIRQNMHNIDQGSISLYKELALCKNYLELEKLRFKELINFHFDIEEDIDTEDIPVPPLIIQPLIENAIRHGLLPRQSPDSMVTIRVKESLNRLIIEVEDNGIGLTAAARNKSTLHQSLGLMNIRKRFEHIRKLQQKNIAFTIKEITKEGSVAGTLAVIEIEL